MTVYLKRVSLVQIKETELYNSIKNIHVFSMKKFPEKFFDILYQNDELFLNQENSELLPNIYFSELYNDSIITSSIKETIWKYLQCILFSIVPNIQDKESFGINNKLFEVINGEEFKSKLENTDLEYLSFLTSNLDSYFSELKVMQYVDEENIKWIENALLREMSSILGNEKEKIKVSLYNDIEYLKASELILNNNEYAKFIKPKN